MLSVGLLGLLGFASCSPRLRPGPAVSKEQPVDTLKATPPGDFREIRLMYGVPPARFEVMQMPDSTVVDKKTEIR